MKTKLIVGLGNPGEKYNMTRHNVGFLFVDFLSKKMNIPLKHEKKKTVYGKKLFPQIETELIFLKPMTFSNLSTEAVLYVASFLKVLQEDVFVVYDDINTHLGECSFNPPKEKVFHNGVRNLIKFFLDDNFVKCGIGIGPLPSTISEEDYYLTNFKRKELATLKSTFERVELLVNDFTAAGKSSQPIKFP